MSSIGKRVKLLRQKEDISLAQLSHNLDIEIAPSTISNLENGKHSPNGEIIVALSKYFNQSCDWLLTGSEFIPKKVVKHYSFEGKEVNLSVKEPETKYRINLDEIKEKISEMEEALIEFKESVKAAEENAK